MTESEIRPLPGTGDAVAGAVTSVSAERYRLLVQSIQDYAIFMLDTEGRVISWNLGAERIKGYRPEEILGHHFSEFYPPDVRGRAQSELDVAREVGRFEDEGWRLRKDGTLFWATVVITALREADGTLVGFSKVTRDLSDRRRHEEDLRQSEERFRLMVESVRDYAIFMLDPEGHVTSWNAGAEHIKGYRADEILGKHFSLFYPAEALARKWPDYELATARKEGRFEDEGWRLRKDGSRFWANVVITALFDRKGTLRGFAKVTRDLTARKRIEMLEQEGRRMNEFLAMLGHELRNPLAPIRNAVAVMGAREIADPSIEWARDLIERQVGHLSRLVDDLLDASRITSGKVALHREPLDLGQLVSRAVDTARPLLEERKHKLEVTVHDPKLRVMADATRLSQVVLNLLNNAAKYTPEGGHVWVELARAESQALLTVRDDGIGMTPDLIPRVFDLFIQGERGLDRSEGGLGIGLTLVRRLVEMHGGTVLARSRGTGLGSEFTVRLPLLGADASKAAEEGGAGKEDKRPEFTPLRVLVVDDNRDSTESMSLLLELWGHEVETAGDGEEALDVAPRQRPDVVLLDIGLPGMSGYELAERLRARPELKETVLVALTGYGLAQDKERARQAGMTVHLVKPVQPQALQKLLLTLGASRGTPAKPR